MTGKGPKRIFSHLRGAEGGGDVFNVFLAAFRKIDLESNVIAKEVKQSQEIAASLGSSK